MNAIKNVLSWEFVIALIAMIFSMPQARADGVHGVRETPREILVEVPKFCRPLKVVWEVRWEQNATNEENILSFVQRNEKKMNVRTLQRGLVVVETVWSGGTNSPIQKLDAKGKPIKIDFLSILALGGGEKLLNKNNWVFIFADGKVMDISPPVNVGTWGKCT